MWSALKHPCTGKGLCSPTTSSPFTPLFLRLGHTYMKLLMSRFVGKGFALPLQASTVDTDSQGALYWRRKKMEPWTPWLELTIAWKNDEISCLIVFKDFFSKVSLSYIHLLYSSFRLIGTRFCEIFFFFTSFEYHRVIQYHLDPCFYQSSKLLTPLLTFELVF